LKPLFLPLYLACERYPKYNKSSQPDSRGQGNNPPRESGLTTIRLPLFLTCLLLLLGLTAEVRFDLWLLKGKNQPEKSF
jgi:hypothetical protein